MAKFLNERFVAVRIEDKKDDLFAAKLGLSQEGYPNVAVYDAESEYLGRVIGFGGKEPWFKQVGEAWQVSAKLADAKAAAAKDPATWAAFADLVGEIPGREKDALTALDRIPEASRGKDFGANRAAFASKLAWIDVDRAIRASTKDAKTPDAFKVAAPGNLERVEAFLKEFGGQNPKVDPIAWSRKGSLLMMLDRKADAIEVVTKLLKDWPESPQAQSVLRSMR